MTTQSSTPANDMADETAMSLGWPNDECLQATQWFCGSSDRYEWQATRQPSPLGEQASQDDVNTFESEFGDFAIDLEEYANTGDMPMPKGHRDDVDWEVVADYLMAVRERNLN